MNTDENVVVMLSDSDAAASIIPRLTSVTNSIASYASVEDLIRARPLASVKVLVVNARPQPKGVLLATLGKMSVEFPDMRKIAVLDGPPPLAMAKYLAACGIEMVWNGPE